MPIHVTVWNEYIHERNEEKARAVYPNGIHSAIADFLKQDSKLILTTGVLDEPDQGLSEAKLNETDVLIWWGHRAHQQVGDELVERIVERVRNGMGMIFLHSGHFSKPFKRMMGTSCNLKWWKEGDHERIFTVLPGHPIAEGIPEYFELPAEETYSEKFDIPTPDEVVFLSWFSGGAVFRSGNCFHYGSGRIFYFQPGHETCPSYHNINVQRVIWNAVHWAAQEQAQIMNFGHYRPFEETRATNE